jgi:hypothetical protein
MDKNYAAPSDLGRFQGVAIGVGLVGVILWIVGAVVSGDAKTTFFHTYLVAYLFWAGIALGCLGLLMIQYLGGATWGLVIRRQLEAGSHTLWMMLALFIPIATIGLHSLYEWSHDLGTIENEQVRKLIEHKSPYLNPRFFLIRGLIYFAIWIAIAMFLRKWSRQQDERSDMGAVQRSQNLSAPGFVIYGLAVTFASVDWVMSLDVEWFSTIFGLLTLAGQGVATIAFLVAVGVVLSSREPMAEVYNAKHFHDLGKLMLAVVMVWAYFSFSQLLIIWSGNLPEEIPWYLERFAGVWRYIGIGLILLHFALPFLLLLSRDLKRNARRLVMVAWLLIIMRFIDLLWLIVPEFTRGASPNPASYLVYAAATIGIGGIWLGWFFYQLRQRALVPYNDPQLSEALATSGHH